MHHLPKRFIHITRPLALQPLAEIVRPVCNKAYYLPILQAHNKSVNGKCIGRQCRCLMFESRKAGGESIHTSLVWFHVMDLQVIIYGTNAAYDYL